MAIEVRIRGERGAAILVEVDSYEFGDRTDPDDGNWLVSQVTVQVPGFTGKLSLFLRTEDFVQFLSALEQIAVPKPGKASFDTMESQLEFVIEMTKQGTCKVIGRIRDHVPGGDLRFSFDSDQTFLTETINAASSVVRQFPVRGRS